MNKCEEIRAILKTAFSMALPESCYNLYSSGKTTQPKYIPEVLLQIFQMLLRSGARVTRSLSGTSCTSGVPWHPPVATSSFHSYCSKNSFWCSPPSSFICVRWGHPAGTSSGFIQRTFVRDQFLVKHRSKSCWSRNSLVSSSQVSLPNTPPLLYPQLRLNSSFSSKPSKEDSPKPGIIAK